MKLQLIECLMTIRVTGMKIRNLRYLLIAFFTGALLFSICFSTISFAQGAPPDKATFAAYNGSVRVYPNGRTPTRSPSAYGALRSNGSARDQLWVAGIRNTTVRSWAHLQFWRQNQRTGPLVQAGPDRINTLYTFPCSSALGAVTYGWGLSPVGSSACERIVAVINNDDNQIASKAIAQEPIDEEATNGITITRSEELVLVRAYNDDGETVVDVLVGAVQITPLIGQVVDVFAGNRYIHSGSGGQIEPIDLGQASESQSIQDFLDESNWSPETKPLLDKFKSELSITAESPGNSSLTDEQQQILDVHNQLRAEVGVPSLSWSTDLAVLAQDWADKLSRENGFRHRPRNERSGIGENLAAGRNVGVMLGLWTDEKDDYDPNTGTCRPGTECKHYTQMVWRNTTELGCGVASHRTYGRVLVCDYRPAGNLRGRPAY